MRDYLSYGSGYGARADGSNGAPGQASPLDTDSARCPPLRHWARDTSRPADRFQYPTRHKAPMTSLTLAAAIAAMIVAPVPAQPTGTPSRAKADVPFGAVTSQPGPAETEGTIVPRAGRALRCRHCTGSNLRRDPASIRRRRRGRVRVAAEQPRIDFRRAPRDRASPGRIPARTKVRKPAAAPRRGRPTRHPTSVASRDVRRRSSESRITMLFRFETRRSRQPARG